MGKRILFASVVAALGTTAFLCLRVVLVGLLEPHLYIVGCFIGAFLSSLVFAVPQRRSFRSWILPATGICFVTYATIASCHLLHRVPTWDHTVPTEALGLVFWAVIGTSWWLVPAVAATMTVVGKLVVGTAESVEQRSPAV